MLAKGCATFVLASYFRAKHGQKQGLGGGLRCTCAKAMSPAPDFTICLTPNGSTDCKT